MQLKKDFYAKTTKSPPGVNKFTNMSRHFCSSPQFRHRRKVTVAVTSRTEMARMRSARTHTNFLNLRHTNIPQLTNSARNPLGTRNYLGQKYPCSFLTRTT